MTPKLLISRDGRLLRLTLNRPEKRNALDMNLTRAILDALVSANNDESIGAVLLAGAGPVFCSGMDLDEILEEPRGVVLLHKEFFAVQHITKKPLVAAVQGACLGGGLGLALNAHIVVAASDARIGLPELRLGLWPFMIFSTLEAAVGLRRATSLALSGRVMDGAEAERIGLVDIVTKPEELESSATWLAQELSEASATAAGLGLEFVHGDRVPGRAAEFRRRGQESEDFREGVRAFLEKRSPVWPSHQARRRIEDEPSEAQ